MAVTRTSSGGRGAHVDRRALQLLELGEGHRTVVLGRRESESVLHEVFLAGAVAAVHGVYLRQRDVAFVYDEHVILREIVNQAERARALGAAVEITRVVLDAGAVPQLLDHLDVVFHALLDALRLRRASGTLEEFDLPAQIQVYLLYGAVDALLGGYEEARGVERQVVERVDTLPRRGVDGLDGLDLVVVEHYAEALAAEFAEGRHDVHRVAVDAERRRFQVAFGARVERFDQLVEEMLVADDLPDPDVDGRGMEIRRVAGAVEARYARYDDHVAAPRQQRGHGAQAHFLDLGVDRKVFFDEGVRRGEVGLRLVIVVVGDEILHGVLREEIAELAVKLRRERLVVAQDERRAVQLRDDVGHGEGLSRACHPQQGVMFGAVPDRADELCDRFRLVAHRGVIRYQLEIHGAKVDKKNGMVKCRPGLAKAERLF